MEVNRGDLILVDLEPKKGSEQGKTRPCIVIQNDIGNTHAPTTIVAALSSGYDDVYPTDVEIRAGEEQVNKDTKAMLNQIFTIDKQKRIKKKFGQITGEKMNDIDEAIEISLGLSQDLK